MNTNNELTHTSLITESPNQLNAVFVTAEDIKEALVTVSEDRGHGAAVRKYIETTLKPWRSTDGDAYVTLPDKKTIPVGSDAFQAHLNMAVKAPRGGFISENILRQAQTHARNLASNNTAIHKVSVRVARDGDEIFVELSDNSDDVIKVDANGWDMAKGVEIKFHCPRKSFALPKPQRGGKIELLRKHLNLATEDDFKRVVGWLLGALRGLSPYPILQINGAKGSGKSTATKILTRLIDPSGSALRTPPASDRDFVAAVKNSFVLSFDNVSSISYKRADDLCRLSTGGVIGGRELYKDFDEANFQAARPIILNGIPSASNRTDLLERSITINLPSLKSDKAAYRTESELLEAFEMDHPKILGALLDALSVGLRDYATTKVSKMPRMADWALFVTAAEKSFGWGSEAIVTAYNKAQRLDTVDNLSDSTLVAGLLNVLPEGFKQLTSTEWVESLRSGMLETRGLPVNGRQFSDELKRLEDDLPAIGLIVSRGRSGAARWIGIERIPVS